MGNDKGYAYNATVRMMSAAGVSRSGLPAAFFYPQRGRAGQRYDGGHSVPRRSRLSVSSWRLDGDGGLWQYFYQVPRDPRREAVRLDLVSHDTQAVRA
jgi:hypothetical protein